MPTSSQSKTTRLYFDVSKDGWTGGLQLGISELDENGTGHGYRIAGPKYNGSSKVLLKTEIDARDAEEIRSFLDAKFPTKTSPVSTERSLWQSIAGALNAAQAAGLAVGIDLDGTLTDHKRWSVIWDRDTKQWTVAAYDTEDGAA